MFTALSTPTIAAMLVPAEAYAFSRTCSKIQVSFEELGLRQKIRQPKVFCAVAYLTRGKEWSYDRAVKLYENSAQTPYKNKRRLVADFLSKVMDYRDLYKLGYEKSNVKAMRIALRLQRFSAIAIRQKSRRCAVRPATLRE